MAELQSVGSNEEFVDSISNFEKSLIESTPVNKLLEVASGVRQACDFQLIFKPSHEDDYSDWKVRMMPLLLTNNVSLEISNDILTLFESYGNVESLDGQARAIRFHNLFWNTFASIENRYEEPDALMMKIIKL